MDDLAQLLLDFIQTHHQWLVAVIFVTAFGESFALVGLLFPGTTLLFAAGALMPGGSVPQLPIVLAAILGAVLGDALSYWLGRRFGGGIASLWPFSRYPGMLVGGVRFFERHGGKSVFIGRFFGPIRAVVPLAAGIMRMPSGRFWIANISSALVWAPMLLLLGDVVGEAGNQLLGRTNTALLVLAGLTLAGVAAAVVAVRAARSKG
ncbi:MAG: DedA family protein [Thiohalocapsa sp.]